MVGLPLITNGCVVLFSGKLPGADADVFNPSQIKLQQKKKGNGGKNQPLLGPVGEENGPTCSIYIPAFGMGDYFTYSHILCLGKVSYFSEPREEFLCFTISRYFCVNGWYILMFWYYMFRYLSHTYKLSGLNKETLPENIYALTD